MTKLLLTALAVFSTMTANAALNLKGRLDLNNTSYNDDARANGGVPKWQMKPQKLDLGMSGNIDENVSYGVTLELKTTSAAGSRSGQNAAISEAQITDKMSENMALTLGKFASDIGGWEAQYSSSDRYATSMYTSMFNYDYSGLKLTGMFGDHSVALHYAHPENQGPATAVANATVNPYYNDTGGIAGLVYMGGFAENMFKLLVTYHSGAVAPKTGAILKEVKETYTSVGFKYDAEPVLVSLDYNMYANENAADIMNSSSYSYSDGQKNTLTSIVIDAGYKIDNLMPKLQVASEVKEVKPDGGTATKTTYTTAGLALEYTPNTEAMFRYHVAYTTSSSKTDQANATTETENHLIIGTRFTADILK